MMHQRCVLCICKNLNSIAIQVWPQSCSHPVYIYIYASSFGDVPPLVYCSLPFECIHIVTCIFKLYRLIYHLQKQNTKFQLLLASCDGKIKRAIRYIIEDERKLDYLRKGN